MSTVSGQVSPIFDQENHSVLPAQMVVKSKGVPPNKKVIWEL